MVSSLGNVSAGDVGLWMSGTNYIGEHGSVNRVYIEKAIAHTSDGRDIILNNPYGQKDISKVQKDIYFHYDQNAYITSVTFGFHVYRSSGVSTVYTRHVYPEVTFPVENNGWVCGVTKTSNSIGMYFTADNHYPKANECKMDTIHCFMDSKEVFRCPGGKFHYPETWTVQYPNGDDWT